MARRTEPITELGALLSALWRNQWGTKKTYAHIYRFLPDTCKVQEHFDDGKGHSGAFTSEITDVAIPVFQEAQQKGYITGKLELGYISTKEFVLTNDSRLLEEVSQIVTAWRELYYYKRKSTHDVACGKPGTYIKVTSLPEGEAPEEIRRAWVGLVLPCEPTVRQSRSREKGAPSLKENDRNRSVYSVPQGEALIILAQRNPTVATWWTEHDFRLSGVDCNYFSFSDTEVKEIAGTFEHQN